MSRLEKLEDSSSPAVPEDLLRGEIESELQLVLGDPELKKNSNSAKFLKFVVDETLEGRGARLKAYTIATLALERESSFDPQTNSIVRVQAMRVRELLESYYSGAGATDPVTITLRRGTYQPYFERKVRPEGYAKEIAAVGPPPEATSRRPFPNRAAAWSLFGLVVVAAAALVAWNGWPSLVRASGSVWPAAVAGPLDGPPSVIVEAPDTLGASTRTLRLSARLFGSIEEGFSHFEYIALRSSSFQSRVSIDNGYVLYSNLEDSGNGQSDVALRLVREPTGDVVWSRHYDDVNADDRYAIDKLANSVVADLADPNGGAIYADIRDRLQTAMAPLRGYSCLIGGVEFLRNRAREQRALERKCLETEVEANAKNVGALTLLSTILISSYLDGAEESHGIADLQRAQQLAGMASDLAPQRAATLDTLFLTRFYGKRFNRAFDAARQELMANPNGSLFTERVAAAYISRGSYEDGLALLRPLETSILGPPIASVPFLALAAHMRGDANATFDYARRTSAASMPLGLLMRIVACHERGDAICVDAASAQLRSDFPGFAVDIPAALDRYAMTDAIKSTLLKDLAAAGYAPTTTDR